MQNEDKARKIADKIASSLQADVSAGINRDGDWENLQAKLDRMYQEMQTGGRIAPATQPAFSPKPKTAAQAAPISHASQERFNVNEAIVDELVEFFEKEKACSFEPNGKPCDHCAMCSSRGF
jgi:hypothetical protein